MKRNKVSIVSIVLENDQSAEYVFYISLRCLTVINTYMSPKILSLARARVGGLARARVGGLVYLIYMYDPTFLFDEGRP